MRFRIVSPAHELDAKDVVLGRVYTDRGAIGEELEARGSHHSQHGGGERISSAPDALRESRRGARYRGSGFAIASTGRSQSFRPIRAELATLLTPASSVIVRSTACCGPSRRGVATMGPNE